MMSRGDGLDKTKNISPSVVVDLGLGESLNQSVHVNPAQEAFIHDVRSFSRALHAI